MVRLKFVLVIRAPVLRRLRASKLLMLMLTRRLGKRSFVVELADYFFLSCVAQLLQYSEEFLRKNVTKTVRHSSSKNRNKEVCCELTFQLWRSLNVYLCTRRIFMVVTRVPWRGCRSPPGDCPRAIKRSQAEQIEKTEFRSVLRWSDEKICQKRLFIRRHHREGWGNYITFYDNNAPHGSFSSAILSCNILLFFCAAFFPLLLVIKTRSFNMTFFSQYLHRGSISRGYITKASNERWFMMIFCCCCFCAIIRITFFFFSAFVFFPSFSHFLKDSRWALSRNNKGTRNTTAHQTKLK